MKAELSSVGVDVGVFAGLFVGITAGGLAIRLGELFMREPAAASSYGLAMTITAFVGAILGMVAGVQLTAPRGGE